MSSLLYGFFAKETYNLKEPTSRSQPTVSQIWHSGRDMEWCLAQCAKVAPNSHCTTLPNQQDNVPNSQCSLQHTATHCNILQHTATHCNKLQHTATHCNTLQHTECQKPQCAIFPQIHSALLCQIPNSQYSTTPHFTSVPNSEFTLYQCAKFRIYTVPVCQIPNSHCTSVLSFPPNTGNSARFTKFTVCQISRFRR